MCVRACFFLPYSEGERNNERIKDRVFNLLSTEEQGEKGEKMQVKQRKKKETLEKKVKEKQ